ncbi:N-formylglutamate amidohydrolase [Sphingomonas sp. Leaf33]|uniref:N-formylglutamate amidohydrolase n=1 Tax=Sphingomonas sp. Leaf33 TaxID=1736215 RepID=UPI0006FDA36D|nr:N-formylglutamate amidohydrolase [Sphingomonas sp. Leaf33]KQN26274.1 N-formylglutamate amidohydrolase [Sphingomonas sp. Leaf33]
MMPDILAGDARVLLLCDHASNHVPDDIDLGIDSDLLERHIAIDIGAGPLTRALARHLDAPAVLGTISRLVIDLHREPDHPGLIPVESDGNPIPGNVSADRVGRIARFYTPYHRAVGDTVTRIRPDLIVAIHSFTPRLESAGPERPWHVGILSNRDRRAAGPAIASLAARPSLTVGDNEPYSGRLLNLTLNRHAEARGIPSFSIEIRNDLIRDAIGIDRWVRIIGETIADVRNSLAQQGRLAT